MTLRLHTCFGLLTAILIISIMYALNVFPQKVTYFRISDDLNYEAKSLPPPTMVLRVLTEKGVSVSANYTNAAYLFFETYGDIDNIMLKIRYPRWVRFVAGISGTDLLAGKDRLAVFMKGSTHIPQTFITSVESDVDHLKNTFDTNSVYIAKKNIQRQAGLHLFNTLSEIDDLTTDFVVIQKMLQNPLLINGRKINIRIYLLVRIDNVGVTMFSYPGFVYYTPNKFKCRTLDTKECITTGYIDREVYKHNPLTVEDMLHFFGDTKYNKMINNVNNMLSYVSTVYSPILRKLAKFKTKSRNIVNFSIFGCDVAIDNKFEALLIEINKGPSLDPHDARDDALKHDMVRGAHDIIENQRITSPWCQVSHR